MVNRVRRTNNLPIGSGVGAGIVLEDRSQRVAVSISQADGKRFVALQGFEKKTANFTITAKDNGKTFAFDDAAGSLVASLPAADATTKGMVVRFVVEQLAGGGAGHAVSPVAADQIIGNGFTPADNKDAICSAASDRLGDFLELTCDGELGWYITGVTGTWAREA